MNKKNEQLMEVIGIIMVVAIIMGPPLVLETSTYPIAVVTGDSMYPILKNGYIVVFSLRGVNVDDIPNGTLIAFVQTQTGLPMFEALTGHPVTHEVMDRVVNQNGQVYYQTKGVNNLYPDPQLLPAKNVLGVEVKAIPYLGYPILFFAQPGGMVALIGLIVVAYLGGLERRIILDKAKREILTELSSFVDHGTIEESEFRVMERAINYPDEGIDSKSPVVNALVSASLKGKLPSLSVKIENGYLTLKGRNLEVKEKIVDGFLESNSSSHRTPRFRDPFDRSLIHETINADEEPLFRRILPEEPLLKRILPHDFAREENSWKKGGAS